MSDTKAPFDHVHIYVSGVVACSVCVPKETTREEIVAAVNAKHPTGLNHGWDIDETPAFSGGQSNPCVCEQDAGRLHYLMVC